MTGIARIGITTSFEAGRQHLDHRYVQAVEAAGGIPLIVPVVVSQIAAHEIASLIDGLIMTGGPGITRGLIGTLPEDLPAVDEARDRSDALIFRALADRPILGICYGMQFANAMAGGTIYGDAQAQTAAGIHSADRGAGDHTVRIAPDSRLSALLRTDQLVTNTHHIQAIGRVGEGLRVTARAADGVIEAIESGDGRVIGVQFHPERMLDRALPLFSDLVERARSSR